MYMRKEGDSNPRFPLGEYTLSRRASSTTRAPFLTKRMQRYRFSTYFRYAGSLFNLFYHTTFSPLLGTPSRP